MKFCVIFDSNVTKIQKSRQNIFFKNNIINYTKFMKILFLVFIFFSLNIMEVGVPADINIGDIISVASSVVVYKDGNFEKQQRADRQQIIGEFKKLLNVGHEMPAFGVALHEDVQVQKQSGLFVEFCFNEMMEYNQMPFCRLLVQVKPEDSGFNIIRYHDAKYEGRCYYVSLGENTMQNFYDFILSLESCNCDTLVS